MLQFLNRTIEYTSPSRLIELQQDRFMEPFTYPVRFWMADFSFGVLNVSTNKYESFSHKQRAIR